MADTAGSAAAPAASSRNCRRGSFIAFPPSRSYLIRSPRRLLSATRTLVHLERDDFSLAGVTTEDHSARAIGPTDDSISATGPRSGSKCEELERNKTRLVGVQPHCGSARRRAS